MQEIVREIPGAARPRAAKQPKAARPRSVLGLLAGIVVIVSGLVLIALVGIGTAAMAAEGELGDKDTIEGLVYFFLECIGILIAGGMILAGQHKAGGVVALVLGGLASLGFWQGGVFVVIGGMAALLVRDNLARYVSALLAIEPSQPIAALAKRVKRCEADVELAVLTLREQGRNVSFDEDTRVVSAA
jgi:hypothetical protein